MRVIIFAKTRPEYEERAHEGGSSEGMQEMARFSAELNAAGILVSEGALEPSRKGATFRFDGGGKHTVTDGPFTEAKELVAGYWLWQVSSLDEAIEWLKRAPFPDGVQLELRPLIDLPEGMSSAQD